MEKKLTRPLAVISAAAAAGVLARLLPAVKVKGSSMSPTLEENDVVLCIGRSRPRRGDIMAARLGGRTVIKRIIAFGGDTVMIDAKGTVSVNGVILDEPYVKKAARGECDIDFPHCVPTGKMFMLGDNRGASTDSRYAEFGEVSRRSTVGRAVFRLYPLSRAGRIRQAACKGGWNYE